MRKRISLTIIEPVGVGFTFLAVGFLFSEILLGVAEFHG
jgi:hypothetical protein